MPIPGNLAELYIEQPEPHAMLNIQLFGLLLLAVGVIQWFARDFQEWAAVPWL